MKEDKNKIDKELKKQLIIFILGTITIGSIVGTALMSIFSSILSLGLSLPMQIILGFVSGGITTGTYIGLSIKNGIKNIEYENPDEENLILFEETEKTEFDKQDTKKLSIVKGSGSNYNYKFKERDKPKLEIVHPNKNNKRR